jgi:hypothetical protein
VLVDLVTDTEIGDPNHQLFGSVECVGGGNDATGHIEPN